MPLRKVLLASGALSSLLYVGTDVLAALLYPDYHSFTSQAVSELMANGAPTERLVDPPFLLYSLLVIAFAVGLWKSAENNRALRAAAGLLFANGVLGLTGPTLFEMNLRGAQVGVAREDVLHIAVTSVLGLVILFAMGFGAFARGRRFRVYSFVSIAITSVFAVLASFDSRHIAVGEPTPWLGLTERIGIGAYLLWQGVLSASFFTSRSTAVSLPNPRPQLVAR